MYNKALLTTAISVFLLTICFKSSQAETKCQTPTQAPSTVDSNTTLVSRFFDAQNEQCPASSFNAFFSSNYSITNIGEQEYQHPQKANIAKRITAFRKMHPNYRVKVIKLVANTQSVFAWFKVLNHKNNNVILNSFTVFDIANGKIDKAYEMVSEVSKK